MRLISVYLAVIGAACLVGAFLAPVESAGQGVLITGCLCSLTLGIVAYICRK